MTEARDLFADYLRQRQEVRDPPLIWEPDAAGQAPMPQPRPAPAPAPIPQPPGTTRMAPPPPPGRTPTRASGKPGDWRRGAPAVPPTGLIVAAPEKDLFSGDPLAGLSLEQLAEAVRRCTKCPLCSERTNAVPGEGPGRAPLVVVGEGPGATEDETGRPFVGRAGQLLTDILAAIALPREQVFICNVVKCRPPANRKPQPDEIEACVPYLRRQLDLIRPKVILAMGNTAAETLLNTKQSLGSLRGRVHQFRGIPLVVTYHPAALLRNPHWKKPTWDDVRIARQLVDS